MREKLRLLFDQTMMVSTGILFLLGIEGVVCHFTGRGFEIYWYYPISIILSGFFCGLLTMLFWTEIMVSMGLGFWLRVVLHCILELGIISLAGWIFRWYTTGSEYLIVMIFYFLIYGFVWLATLWMQKMDEEKINQALREIQDEE